MHLRPLSRHLGLAMLLVVGCDGPPATKTGDAPAARSDPPAPGATAATPTPASDTYNLRGAPVQGGTRRTESTFELQDAQLTTTAGDIALSGVMSIKSQTTEDLEILEVGDGLVRRGRLNHVLNKSTNTLRIKLPDGTEQSESSEDNGALHGRVETVEFISGQWKRTLEGPAPTPEQARLLSAAPFDDASYPTAIKIGESWTETGPELRRWLGSDVLSARGEVKNTLLAVESQQGEKVAVIESLGEIEATILDGDNNEMKLTFGLQGKVRRSLDRAIDLEGTAEGAIKFSGDVVQDGVKVALAVTGRCSIKTGASLR